MNAFDLNFILVIGLQLECTKSKALLVISGATKIFTIKASVACFYILRCCMVNDLPLESNSQNVGL